MHVFPIRSHMRVHVHWTYLQNISQLFYSLVWGSITLMLAPINRETMCACVSMGMYMRACVCMCMYGEGGHLPHTCSLHFLRACSIVWLVQPVSTPQKVGKGDWVHSRIRNSPSSEKLPAGHSIGPLRENIVLKIDNYLHM